MIQEVPKGILALLCFTLLYSTLLETSKYSGKVSWSNWKWRLARRFSVNLLENEAERGGGAYQGLLGCCSSRFSRIACGMLI